jgi:hypothetical protein
MMLKLVVMVFSLLSLSLEMPAIEIELLMRFWACNRFWAVARDYHALTTGTKKQTISCWFVCFRESSIVPVGLCNKEDSLTSSDDKSIVRLFSLTR